MSRIRACRPAAFLLTLGLAVSGVALADDNSMSRLTGESYAFFNDLDYHAGGFNTARAPQADSTRMAKTPAKDMMARRKIADRPAPATQSSVQRDDRA